MRVALIVVLIIIEILIWNLMLAKVLLLMVLLISNSLLLIYKVWINKWLLLNLLIKASLRLIVLNWLLICLISLSEILQQLWELLLISKSHFFHYISSSGWRLRFRHMDRLIRERITGHILQKFLLHLFFSLWT